MRLPRTRADDLPAADPDFRFPLSEVPMPRADWTTKGACRRTDLHGKELQDHVARFFPAPSQPITAAVAELCAGCEVREQCDAFSVRWRVEGVWGGRREQDRAKVARKQRRNRQLKGAA